MTKRAKEIRDLMIDEVSLVDKGANQHARTVIAKRHVEEETKMEQYFDEAGAVVDLDTLSEGDVVFDEAGDPFVFTADDEDEEVEVEPEPVAKSVFGTRQTQSSSSLADTVRVELSKALTDADRDSVIAKALGQVDEIAKRAERAEKAAEAERNLRLDREYTEIAKGYNVPVAPEDLGRVLKRLAEVLTVPEQTIIAKCLEATSASDELFREYGNRGGGENVDIMSQVDAVLTNSVSKGAGSREETIEKVFAENPLAYEDYLAERQGR